MIVIGSVSHVPMILAIPRLIPPLRISLLRLRPLEPLEGLDEGEELRRQHCEPNLLCVVVLPWILDGSVPLAFSRTSISRSPRLPGIMLSSPVLVISTFLPFSFVVMFSISCASNRSFGYGDYVILQHDILVPPLEQLVNRRGGMQ